MTVIEDADRPPDPSYWFDNDDINTFLEHISISKKSLVLPDFVATRLFHGEDDLNSVFTGFNTKKRDSCVVPINYNNTHWLALCCTPEHAYIYNSLSNLPCEKTVTALVAPIITEESSKEN